MYKIPWYDREPYSHIKTGTVKVRGKGMPEYAPSRGGSRSNRS